MDWQRPFRQHQREINELRKIQRKKRKKKRITDKSTWKWLNKESLKMKLAKSSYSDFLKSDYWKTIRVFVLKRDKHKCAKCPRNSKLHIHHKTYENHFNEHNNLNDLITLCEYCHRKVHKAA